MKVYRHPHGSLPRPIKKVTAAICCIDGTAMANQVEHLYHASAHFLFPPLENFEEKFFRDPTSTAWFVWLKKPAYKSAVNALCVKKHSRKDWPVLVGRCEIRIQLNLNNINMELPTLISILSIIWLNGATLTYFSPNHHDTAIILKVAVVLPLEEVQEVDVQKKLRHYSSGMVDFGTPIYMWTTSPFPTRTQRSFAEICL